MVARTYTPAIDAPMICFYSQIFMFSDVESPRKGTWVDIGLDKSLDLITLDLYKNMLVIHTPKKVDSASLALNPALVAQTGPPVALKTAALSIFPDPTRV